jgi:tetratricopeptide (TPR) repeat protein
MIKLWTVKHWLLIIILISFALFIFERKIYARFVGGCFVELQNDDSAGLACKISLINPFIRTQDERNILIERAAQNTRKAEYRSAYSDLERLSRNGVLDIPSMRRFGYIAYRFSHYERSEEAFEAVLTLDPDDSDTEFRLVATIAAGYDEKVQFEKISTLGEKFPNGLYLKRELASLLERKSRLSEAADLYVEVIHSRPKDTKAFNGLIAICHRSASHCIPLMQTPQAATACNGALPAYVSLDDLDELVKNKLWQASELEAVRQNRGSWVFFARDYAAGIEQFTKDPLPHTARGILVLNDLLDCAEASYVASAFFDPELYEPFHEIFPLVMRRNYRHFLRNFMQ